MLAVLFFLCGLSLASEGEWTLLGVSGHAGTITMNERTGSSLFYWQFTAEGGDIDSDSRPLILWLQGGPGCSGETGLLLEKIGPISIDASGTAYKNADSWASLYHIISIDFPYGAGFSRFNPVDSKYTTGEATGYLYDFLVLLCKAYPNWFDRDFYIVGESYAGHWVPAIANHILTKNYATQHPLFRLKGIAMGGPWIDPASQTQRYADYAYSTGLISSYQRDICKEEEENTMNFIRNKDFRNALASWESSYSQVSLYAGGINIYDMRKYDVSYDMSPIEAWLNLKETKDMLHVDEDIKWVPCNQEVYSLFTEDIMTSSLFYLEQVLPKINVLIFSGQDDLIVNTLATQDMIAKIQLDYIEKFREVQRTPWENDGQVAGYGMKYNNLNYVTLLKAGHMASYDQPTNVREMIYRFVNNFEWL